MAKNFDFDPLLKTKQQTNTTKQTDDDILGISKRRIKEICKNLSLPSKDYNPKSTVMALQDYLQDKNTKGRILYSEISSLVFGFGEEQQGNFATNIENLLSFSLNSLNQVSEDQYKIIVKIYDHFQLAIKQKLLNSNTEGVIKDHISSITASAKDEISKELRKEVKNVEKEYISILGIFVSIVFAFIGGVTFSTSVLQNINAVSIYRLLLITDLLAIVLVNTVYILMKFICQINNKAFKPFNMIWFNIAFGVIGVLVIIAWVIDMNSLVSYIEQFLPWIK